MKEKTGKQVLDGVRRSINARMARRAPATKTEIKHTLATLPKLWVEEAFSLKGVEVRTASADDLFDVLYGIRWAMAYKRPLAEYFGTAWGVDNA